MMAIAIGLSMPITAIGIAVIVIAATGITTAAIAEIGVTTVASLSNM
jgi:hypothetical protein